MLLRSHNEESVAFQRGINAESIRGRKVSISKRMLFKFYESMQDQRVPSFLPTKNPAPNRKDDGQIITAASKSSM